MTDQELMREMARKGIHSINIQSYKGDMSPNSQHKLDHPRTHLPLDDIYAPLEWLKQRVDEVVWYGRKK